MLTKTILVVDDNGDLIDSLRHALEQAGFDTLGAIGADEAFNLLRSHRIDAVICDQFLGDADWTGMEICAEAGRIRPATRCLIISGLPQEPDAQGMPFLQKPFNMETLLHHLGEILALAG